MKIKLVDLTLRQIIKICDKHNKNCCGGPLFNSVFKCYEFDTRFKTFGGTYDRKKLMNERVEINE